MLVLEALEFVSDRWRKPSIRFSFNCSRDDEYGISGIPTGPTELGMKSNYKDIKYIVTAFSSRNSYAVNNILPEERKAVLQAGSDTGRL